MKKYLLYESDIGCCYSFFEDGDSQSLKLLDKDAKLIWSVEAASFSIALLKMHKFLGWEPYKPSIECEQDLLEYIPKDKFDSDNVELLINLGYPVIKPVIPNLFEWIQDMNWPIAQIIAPFLAGIGKHLVEDIKYILNTDDQFWKYWTLIEVVDKMEIEGVLLLRNELLRLANNPTAGERFEEVDVEAKRIIEERLGL